MKLIDLNDKLTFFENNKTSLNLNSPKYIYIIDTSFINIYNESLKGKEGEIENLNNINNFFNNLGSYNLPFHYYISRNGNIYKCRDEIFISPYIEEKNGLFYKIFNNIDNISNCEVPYGELSDSLNKIIICIEGNFNKIIPSLIQFNNLISLCKNLKEKYPIFSIFGLNEINTKFNTPGIFIKMNEIRGKVIDDFIKESYIVPNGEKIYSFGSRNLFLDEDNEITGNDVILLQNYLYLIGFLNKNDITGKYDKITYEAICNIQRILNFSDDEINGETNQLVYNYITYFINHRNDILNKNNSYHRLLYYNPNKIIIGNDVKFINNKLYHFYFNKINNEIINENLKDNDKFTKDSELAVKEFQKLIGVEVDGIIGPILFKSLISYDVVIWNIEGENAYISIDNNNTSENSKLIKQIQKIIYRLSKKFNLTNTNITGIYDEDTSYNIALLKYLTGYSLDNIQINGEVDEDFYNFLIKCL